MKQTNFFIGGGFLAQFAHIIYELLLTRDWINNNRIMRTYYANAGKPFDDNILISKYDGYGELKKAFSLIVKELQSRDKDCMESRGGTRDKEWRYVGKNKNPLEDMLNAAVVCDLKTYTQFCFDSSGLIPSEWLNYFFKNTQDLLNINKNRTQGKQVISAEVNRSRNLDLLPRLYEAITQHRIVRFDYTDFSNHTYHVVFHPQFLKEFEGRWHLLGKGSGFDIAEEIYNVALDRIVKESYDDCVDGIYETAEDGFYEQYFKNIVGLSHQGNKVQKILFRTYNEYIFGLINSKPFHPSHRIVKPFADYDDGKYGEFELNVEWNKELLGRILKWGANIELMTPAYYRNVVMSEVSKTMNRYNGSYTSDPTTDSNAY